MMTLAIGPKLQMARTKLKVSQAEVAGRLMITRQTLSKWELGKSLPDLMSLKQLALLYDLSLDSLLEMAKEKMEMLSTINNEELSQLIVAGMCQPKEATDQQRAFISEQVILALDSQAEWWHELVWFAVDKQPIMPSRYYMPNYAITTETSKTCQALFPGYNYKLYLLTKSDFVILNLFDWFERSQVTVYSLAKMDFMVVGKLYDPSIVAGNASGICYRTKNGHFDLVSLRSPEAAKLSHVLAVLDPQHHYFIELASMSLYQFYKKYTKKGYQDR